VSPLSSSSGTPSESISTDDVDDLEVDEVKNLAQLKNAGKLLYSFHSIMIYCISQ
jgi:hypothetical protein